MDRPTIDIYEKIATEWARKRGSARDDRGRVFRRRVGDGLIADLGCGPGRYLEQLGRPVVGLDVSFAMLSESTSPKTPLVLGDLEALPFANESLKGIFARHSYLHIPKARMGEALRQSRRVLKESGLLEMSLIGGSYEGHDSASADFPGRFFANWQADEIAVQMHESGFGDIDVATINFGDGYFDLVVTAKR